MLRWLTARMNRLCTCCKRKHGPRGFIIEDHVAFHSRRTESVASCVGDCMPCWARVDASSLPVVLELCFQPAVRPAHKYGSRERQNRGGRVPLSHHLCKEDSMSLGAHEPRLYSLGLLLTGAMGAPVFLHSGRKKWINSSGAMRATGELLELNGLV